MSYWTLHVTFAGSSECTSYVTKKQALAALRNYKLTYPDGCAERIEVIETEKDHGPFSA